MKLYDLEELHRQQRRDHAIEAIAAVCGLAGAFLLAFHGKHAGWGWWAFLASNVSWIVFACTRRLWFLLLQQVGFTASSLVGIWNWIGS
jgi:nicotinamide riboside transporter PnuC